MSIDIPADLPLLSPGEILGNVPVKGDGALDTLLSRVNWHYATHAPPILNVCPYNVSATTNTFVFPINPSQDSISYQPALALAGSHSWSSNNVTISESEDNSTYTTVTGWAPKALSLTAGTITYHTSGDAFAIDKDSRYIKVEVTHGRGRAIQLMAFCLFPEKMTSISSGKKDSGFIAYDSAAMDEAGPAIHTEYFNRAFASFRNVQKDRVQCLAAWAQAQTPDIRIGHASYSYGRQWAFYSHASIGAPGSHTVKVRVRASDTGGAGSLEVGQENGGAGSSHTFAISSTSEDQEITLTVYGSDMVLYALCEPDSSLIIEYIHFRWIPDIGSDSDLISDAAPPARLSYLSALDSLSLKACIDPYVVTGLNFDPDKAESSTIGSETAAFWSAFQIIPPGTKAMRGAFARAVKGSKNDTPAPSRSWGTMSGTGDDDRIDVPTELTGEGAHPITEENPVEVAVKKAPLFYDASPTSAGGRLFEITEDKEPQIETFMCRLAFGFGGEWLKVSDIADVS